MEYIFGTTFICNDLIQLKAVTFDPKIKSRSITLEGDIYDPEESFWRSRRNNSTILLKLQQYNKLTIQLKKLNLNYKM